MNRQSGYYWVKHQGTWYISGFVNDQYLSAYHFYFSGSEDRFTDPDFEEIDERQIKRDEH